MPDSENTEKPPDTTVYLHGELTARAEVFGELTVWLTYSFAPEWFEDALHEANTGTDHNARRREIVFAVCFAESYLFEWVRDTVLDKGNSEELVRNLNQYFPPGKWQPVIDKWKDVPKKLLNDGLIPATPNLGLPYWENFKSLVGMRNGLVHARSSRPETGQQPEREKPLPSKGDLDKLQAGWPTEVVVTLAKELHKAIGTPVPDWLKMS
jgi:hypothetical protein